MSTFEDAFDVPEHPLASQLDPGEWDRPGICICGQPLPPQREWCGGGAPWSHIICRSCDRLYVDEEDYIAIYDPPVVGNENHECERCNPSPAARSSVGEDT